MSEQKPSDSPGVDERDPRVLVIGPDGRPIRSAGPVGPSGSAEAGAPAEPGSHGAGAKEAKEDEERHITELVEQPAKVMRIGSMIRQLLEEVKSAPLDEASRARLAEIHKASVKELEQGLAPELVEELERLSLPFSSDTPSEPELRIAQAQLVGWLEGLFHGIQTAIYAQQMAARAQLEQMRRALPPGTLPEQALQAAQEAAQREQGDDHGGRGGMYL